MSDKTLTLLVALVLALLFVIYLGLTGGGTGPDPEDAALVESPPPLEEPPAPPRPAPAAEPPPEPPAPAEPEVSDAGAEPGVNDGEPQPQVARTEPEAQPGRAEPEGRVARAEPEPPPLPPLNASDGFVRTLLGEMTAGANLLRMAITDEIIRRFVLTVDNASRGDLPAARDLPVHGPREEMRVLPLDDTRYRMDPASYHRYDMLVGTLDAVDIEQAMTLYGTLLPLFQRAYAELGYGDRDFGEVLAAAIDRILNADTPQGPFELVRPAVMYKYADERIENLSDVEKLLLRMGPENAGKLKAKLREFRASL